MLRRLLNKEKNFEKYRSWYDLSYEETIQLEKEFISKDMGKKANEAMHLCIIIGLFTIGVSSLTIVFLMTSNFVNPYIFTIMVLLVILGIIIVVGSTIEYHSKFNSWLEIHKKIIKK